MTRQKRANRMDEEQSEAQMDQPVVVIAMKPEQP